MGCSKNLVDTEILMKQFEANGYHCTHDSNNPRGEIAVINTCGFIGDAKEESINTILRFAQAKDEGRLGKLFVMGCLSQRYKEELEKEIPQVDKYYGKFDYKKLSHNMANMPSFKMYSFLGCEFDLESLGSLMPDIKNDKAGMIGEASIKINYTQVHTHTMNDWYRIMFGTDGFYYNANRENTNKSEVALVEAAEKNSNYYTISASSYSNNTDQSIFYDNKSDDEQYQRLKAKQAILDHLLYYNSTSSQYKELIDASEALCSDLYRAVAPNKALGNLYENIISGGVGPGSNYFKSKMKALHLGSDNYKESFQDKISKFWNTVKSFSANQMHI